MVDITVVTYESGDSSHVLDGIIRDMTWIEPVHVARRISELGEALKVKLDFQLESFDDVLVAIEREWANRGFPSGFDSIRSDFFGGLLTYAGEYIRRHVNGQWSLFPNPRDGTLEPWVVGSSGEWYELTLITDPFYSDLSTTSFAGIVEGIISNPNKSPTVP